MAWWWQRASGDKHAKPSGVGDEGGGCPVKMGSVKGSEEYYSTCPIPHDQRSADHPMLKARVQDAGKGHPTNENGGSGGHVMIFLDPRNNMKAGRESDYPGLGQTKALSHHRVESSIPKDDFTPGHQADTGRPDKWVYPSEQMFFNAMKRKGWSPSEDEMQAVVSIHNAVNERTWREVQQWEKETHPECGNPKLVRFTGRPTDWSPRARMMGLLGYKMPFDRHDWYIDRCGKKVRYIIDFYNAPPTANAPVAFHLDVRPALDDFESAFDRMRMAAKPWFNTFGNVSDK